MKKPFLLIAGDNYYPISKTGNWIGCFSSYEEAKALVKEVPMLTVYFTKGKRKGEVKKVITEFKVFYSKWGGEPQEWHCDWYDIVDLRDWTK